MVHIQEDREIILLQIHVCLIQSPKSFEERATIKKLYKRAFQRTTSEYSCSVK